MNNTIEINSRNKLHKSNVRKHPHAPESLFDVAPEKVGTDSTELVFFS